MLRFFDALLSLQYRASALHFSNIFRFKKISFSVFKILLSALLFNLLVIPKVLAALSIAQTPLFLVPPASPIVMLNIPKDHQLYFKSFDDYSDLDGDGIPETTYKHSFNYYGYFDSYKCYDYVNDHFEPIANSDGGKYCAGIWSGNFLNWASMTRIDSFRKLLYGGFRVTDTLGETVLERSYLPNDAHSFAKFYQSDDLAKLTPFTANGGITLCNTTFSSGTFSQDVTDAPLLRVAKGNYSLWATSERWQCLWKEEAEKLGLNVVNNGNEVSKSGIIAGTTLPPKVADGDYKVRVKVCVNDALKGSENCKSYKNTATEAVTLKPIGVLQTYGDDGNVHFGLMTGSYGNNKSGGVLRKNAAPITDEINVDSDGTFKSVPADGGIINTLNKLRIYGYRHNGGTVDTNGTYSSQAVGGDNCSADLSLPGSNGFNNGQCSNWGNPQSEIFLESLRYLAGKSASPVFVPTPSDSSRIVGLTHATFIDPMASDNYCAALNIIQFSAGASSYDADDLSGASDINISSVDALVDRVGDGVGISGKSYFVGEVFGTTNNDLLCTAKTVSSLSKVRGLCPEAPGLLGSYAISGLAHYAHVNDIRPDRTDKQTVNTYGLGLSQSNPKIVIDVPGGVQKITLTPACRNSLNNSIKGNCAIVDFKIVEPAPNEIVSAGHKKGKLYVAWDGSEQGGDFDQDMAGVISYDISATAVKIITEVIAQQSTLDNLDFGYVISGTKSDGFHAHSGVNGFVSTDKPASDASVSYEIGSSIANTLQAPLFYATQWGGFIDGNDNEKPDQQSEWDGVNNATGLPPGDGIPDQYFFSSNPKQAEVSLDKILANLTQAGGSSASTISNSTVNNSRSLIFQTTFDSKNWTSQLLAYPLSTLGLIGSTAQWDASATLTNQGYGGRLVFSYNPDLGRGIDFLHANLNPNQQQLLTEPQVNYIRGDQSKESTTNGFRIRKGLLGDIVNSKPLFIGSSDGNYQRLPATEGSEYLNYRGSSAMLTRTPMLAVGANDGMLHVFDASLTNNGKELFAYVPGSVMDNLAKLTSPMYSRSGQHKYFVDGALAVGDAYFNADNDSANEWRTVLLGTLGAGGKGLFALDMTFLDTNNYKTPETAFSAKRVLWEINDKNTPYKVDLQDDLTNNPKQYGLANNLGYTFGQPSVVRLADGQFAAIFGNGYNSKSGNAVLFIVNIKDGSLIRSIGTDTTGDNGLSAPLPVDINNDSIIDAIYAGDLQGNMWKFDVSSNNPSKWAVAYASNDTARPLFTAKIDGAVGQPITVKPEFAFHPSGGILLFFGTGSYFQTDDNIVGTRPQTHSLYGIWDECINISGVAAQCTNEPISGRAVLGAQTIDKEFASGRFIVRQTSANDVIYPEQKGWYMDLVKPPQPGVAAGERVINDAKLGNGRVTFIVNTPSSKLCEAGGEAWLMELNPLTGSRLRETPFDITGDGLVDLKDQINDGNNAIAVSGFKLDQWQPPVILTDFIMASTGVAGGFNAIKRKDNAEGHRQSWVQLR